MSLKNLNKVNKNKPKRIAIVIANPHVSSTTGWPVGFWWSELTHPYYLFSEIGYEMEIFSPDGGKCEADAMSDPYDSSGYSSADLITRGFMNTLRLKSLVENTGKVSDIDENSFDAIIVAGGQSPMFSFENSVSLHKKFAAFYEDGKIACALCHGVAVLRYAKLSGGDLIVKGKTVTGFANSEENFADEAVRSMGLISKDKNIMPWRIEDELKKAGANFIQAGMWKGFAIRDGNLITGQQNFSGTETAKLVIKALGE